MRTRTSSFAVILFATAGVLFAAPAAADTIIAGGNILNQTWTLAGSPYIVQGDITVPAGSTLTIEPGTAIHAVSGDSQASGINPARVEITVAGTLDVNGTAASPVTFRGVSAVPGAWHGVIATSGAASVTLDHATITNAITGLTTAAPASTFAARNVTVDDPSNLGISASAGSPLFEAVKVISATSYGYELTGTSSPTLRNVISRNNAQAGLYWSSSGNLTVQNSTFNANTGVGIQAASSSGPVSVVNSIITNNNGYGLFASSFGTISVSYADIWNNASGRHNGNVSAGVGIIETNPLFVSSSDLRLTSNSPARFATAASADLGALPFDGALTPGLYGTLWNNTTLTTAASPHVLAGDLTVGAGVTLTVEPGATLQFQPSDIMAAGSHTGRGELQIRGTLVADGTAAAPITLTSTSATPGAWYGIDALPGATHLTLDHVAVTRAITGLTWRTATSGHVVTALTIDDPSNLGVSISAGSPLLDAVTVISATSYGFELTGTSSPTLRNVISRSNAQAGLYWSSSGNLTIQHGTFNANTGVGIQAASSSGPVSVVNSIITNNNGYGLFASSFGTISVSYADIWNNASGQYNGNVSAGAGILNANPQFVSSTDLHLLGSSVAIDAGTTGPLIDADGVVRPQNGNGIGGSEWDLGAYEFVLVAMCGNGAVEPGETCDSGAANGSYGACNASCSGLGPRCGDGATNGPEQCDDGNSINTDACLNTCRTPTCGDGFVHGATEECDDGNSVNTDACVGACQNAECGDGYLRTGTEECDDGNTVNNDACSNACVASSCGDGVVHAGEECDDGNSVDSDACRNACLSARCGDGVIRIGSEQCDDGNTISTDACTATCQDAVCGDGITRAGTEECDDANAVDTDACIMGCIAARCGDGHVRSGIEGCDDGNMVNSDACTNACVSSTCGDGVVQIGVETCDDANQVDTDACRNNCGLAMCGDGVVQTGVEACDDTNTTDGDGCSAGCEIETGGPDAGPGGPDAGGDPGDGDGGGCCSTGSGGATRTTSLLAALALLLTLRRRRRRA